MPDQLAGADEISKRIGELSTQVCLPDWFHENEDRMDTPTYDDRRRFRRFRVQGKGAAAALHLTHSLPSIPREEAWHKVYLCDLSRSGFSFFHSDILFPGECQRLVVLDGQVWEFQVARCTRLQARCFQIGVIRCGT